MGWLFSSPTTAILLQENEWHCWVYCFCLDCVGKLTLFWHLSFVFWFWGFFGWLFFWFFFCNSNFWVSECSASPWCFTVLVDDLIVLVKYSGQRDSWSCLDKGLWFWALPWVWLCFVKQKHILQRSACHQPSWDGTSQPVGGGEKWHLSLKFSGCEESQTPHGLITC